MFKRIAIEGPDGSGKSTVAQKLTEHLRDYATTAHIMPYPTNGPVGRFIRSVLRGDVELTDSKESRAMLPLFVADAVDQERTVSMLLESGHVVMDRHPWVSAFAFQVDHYSGHDILGAMRAHSLPKPDLLFVLDVPAEHAVERCGRRGKYADQMFEESLQNLQKVRQRYLDIAKTPHPARTKDPGKTYLLDGTREVAQSVNFIRAMLVGY